MATSYEYPVRDAAGLTDIEILAEAHELVEAFLEFIRTEHIGNDILDMRTLPASKASIENGFRLVIATEPRGHTRQRLASAGLTLARFQSGVGLRMSIAPAPHMAGNGSERQDGSGYHRFDTALAAMATDTRRLQRIFSEAEVIAQRRFEPLGIKPPFREDGTYTWYGHH